MRSSIGPTREGDVVLTCAPTSWGTSFTERDLTKTGDALRRHRAGSIGDFLWAASASRSIDRRVVSCRRSTEVPTRHS
ncbi:MAG: hypothetical protein BGO98_01195 [Myxococcales bacterium 68-20]|nr:MAG: hypothetical protein BGO98_01195 [Myxococcales bacterium 68-20]